MVFKSMRWFVLLTCICAGAGSIAGQSSAALQRANKLPMPNGGMVVVTGSSLVYVSETTNSLVFRTDNSAEGRGGYSDNFYFRLDPDTGKELERVQIEFDSENTTKEIQTREEAMNQKGEDALRRWGVPATDPEDFASNGKPFYSALAAVSPRSAQIETSDGDIHTQTVRFFLMDPVSKWLKPLADLDLSITGLSDIVLKSVLPFPEYRGLIVHFYRQPHMEYDQGTEIYLCLSPKLAAQYHNEVGFAFYNQRDIEQWWFKAVTNFEDAVEADPSHVTAMYNAACTYALNRQIPESLNWLARLKKDGSPAALTFLKKVEKDTDFDLIRKDTSFTDGLKKVNAGTYVIVN